MKKNVKYRVTNNYKQPDKAALRKAVTTAVRRYINRKATA